MGEDILKTLIELLEHQEQIKVIYKIGGVKEWVVYMKL